MKLHVIDTERYTRMVLPHTAPLWAGKRDLATYVDQSREIANSGYGRKHYRTLGFIEGTEIVASFKRYERVIRDGVSELSAIGIGAVFTPDIFRGRGYASAMLATALDEARASGTDVAYLFSDIHPAFYETLGFRTLPSRSFSLRADGLPSIVLRDAGFKLEPAADSDWAGIKRCYDATQTQSAWAFVRTPLVWEWIRLRIQHASEHPDGSIVNLVVRRSRSIVGYALGARVPEHDAYILDEFGYLDAQAATLIGPLLRSASGDLRRVTGWLPPAFARSHVPRAAVRKRTKSIFMAAPLSTAGSAWLQRAELAAIGDGVWSSDHI